MKQFIKFSFILSTAIALMVLAVSGCKDSGTSPGTGTISMNAKYLNRGTSSVLQNAGVTASSLGVDSITISQARVVLAKIKFEAEDEEADFKTAPFILNLNLNGTLQTISVANVPYGTYGEIKFRIHRVDSADVQGLPPADRVQFNDFLAGEGYSIIIDGLVYKNGGSGVSFTFKSRINAEQENELHPPLVVNSATPNVNATMTVNSYKWFRGFNNSLLDPTDSLSTSTIDENLRHSFRVFRDEDENGEDDEGDHDSGDHDTLDHDSDSHAD